MTAIVVFLLAAVVGTTVWVYGQPLVAHFREASKRIDADVALLQALPPGLESWGSLCEACNYTDNGWCDCPCHEGRSRELDEY